LPLSTYTIRTAPVRLSKDNEFQVRAVTFPDLAMIVQTRLPEVVAILAKYQESRELGSPVKSVSEIAIMAARDFPTMTSEIISLCVHGEIVTEAMRETIQSLPFPIQLQALISIGQLTVEEAGGLGNLLAEFRQNMTAMGTPQTN